MINVPADLPPLDHVGYVVQEVDAEVEGFRRVLGLTTFRTYDYVPVRAWANGRLLEQCRLRISIGTLKNAARIELIQPVEGDTPQARFLRETGPGLHHIAFSTNSYEKWREHFEAEGAEIVFEAEAEDDIIGYRRSLYARVSGVVGIVEITEAGRKRK